ncbi:hypothetical protein DER44DRAFT_878006 [Fusarium oxysporum]|nr:hypothetical protein DER44DRAFT_878006 [Fusarium oxysporum]
MPSARAQMKGPVNSAPQSCFEISPTLGDWPPQEGRTVKSHRGCEDSTTLWTSTSLLREGMFAQLQIMLRNIPNKDGQPPSSKLSASLSGDSIARRTMYGVNMLPQTTDFGVTPDEARALHKKQHESDSKMLRFHVIAGKAEYIIDFFQPRGIRSKGKNATVFYPQGSPTVASAQSQAAAEDAAKKTAKDAAIQEEDGIFDGGPTKDFGTTGHDNPGNLI